MIFERYHIKYSNNIECFSILSYRKILTIFINEFINSYSEKYKNETFNKAIIYSKYYLFYKTINCEYNKDIMEVIYNIEYIINKNKSK
jgi:hypothetical protein